MLSVFVVVLPSSFLLAGLVVKLDPSTQILIYIMQPTTALVEAHNVKYN